jgi:hypothetical protein
MSATLRTTAAALALLAPLGAAFAQPAFGPGPVIVAQAQGPWVDSFVVRADGQILTGSALRFRVVGAPGARVLLDVPTVMRNVVVPETRPGVYELDHVVRHTEYPDNFRLASISVEKGGQRTTAGVRIVDGGEFAVVERPVQRPVERPVAQPPARPRDNRAPQIGDLTPSHGERVRERRTTEVSARLKDDETGIDRNSVVLRLNGQDVTRRSRFEGNDIVFRDDLRNGRYTAEVVARDRAGNLARRSWSFEVVDRWGQGQGHGWGHNR